MSGVLEKVARANEEARFGKLPDAAWAAIWEGDRERQEAGAKAAILALADNVTDEMVEAMSAADDCGYSAPHPSNYRAMLLAALRAVTDKTG